MKKNLVLSVLAAAGMLFATSCTQDDLRNGSANGDYIDATFTLATEDGIGTRAIGDGTQANVLLVLFTMPILKQNFLYFVSIDLLLVVRRLTLSVWRKVRTTA